MKLSKTVAECLDKVAYLSECAFHTGGKSGSVTEYRAAEKLIELGLAQLMPERTGPQRVADLGGRGHNIRVKLTLAGAKEAKSHGFELGFNHYEPVNSKVTLCNVGNFLELVGDNYLTFVKNDEEFSGGFKDDVTNEELAEAREKWISAKLRFEEWAASL